MVVSTILIRTVFMKVLDMRRFAHETVVADHTVSADIGRLDESAYTGPFHLEGSWVGPPEDFDAAWVTPDGSLRVPDDLEDYDRDGNVPFGAQGSWVLPAGSWDMPDGEDKGLSDSDDDDKISTEDPFK